MACLHVKRYIAEARLIMATMPNVVTPDAAQSLISLTSALNPLRVCQCRGGLGS